MEASDLIEITVASYPRGRRQHPHRPLPDSRPRSPRTLAISSLGASAYRPVNRCQALEAFISSPISRGRLSKVGVSRRSPSRAKMRRGRYPSSTVAPGNGLPLGRTDQSQL